MHNKLICYKIKLKCFFIFSTKLNKRKVKVNKMRVEALVAPYTIEEILAHLCLAFTPAFRTMTTEQKLHQLRNQFHLLNPARMRGGTDIQRWQENLIAIVTNYANQH